MRVLVGVLVLCLCAWRAHDRSQDWRSDEALWRAAVTSAPAQPRPALNLAVAYARLGQWEASIEWTQRAVHLMSPTHAWMRQYLCQQVTRLVVLAPDPPSFSAAGCAS